MDPEYALCFDGRLNRELASVGVPVHQTGAVRLSRPWTVHRARRTFRDLLRQRRFDAVVCHSSWTEVIFGDVARSAQIPLVFWFHDAPSGRHWLDVWAKFTPPELVLINSRFTARSAQRFYPDAFRQVVYYPVAAPEAAADHDQRAALRDSLATPRTAIVVIQTSRLEAWKGHMLHFQALGRLAHIPNWVCWIVGGPQRPREALYLRELIALAAHLGIADRVRFVGQRSDIPDLLAAADIHCQPNTGPEPFGVAFVEALYAGLPVVSTSLGAVSEIVDASCGVLTGPGDVSELAGALERLITKPGLRARLANAAPRRAQLLCNPATQIARVHDAIRRSIATAPVPEQMAAPKLVDLIGDQVSALSCVGKGVDHQKLNEQ
jgi:glycosyltransferase involved in cell wall biosynthesis